MKPSLFLIPPTWESSQSYGDEFEDTLFSLKCSPKEALLVGQTGALAPLFAAEHSKKNASQSWVCIELVHIHAARDHLILTNPSELNISPTEEESLRASVKEVLSELTSGLFLSTPNRWIVESNAWNTLHTFSPEMATGRNIDAWLPKDTSIPGLARKWRQIQNEIQMIWHDHPVNLERMANGQLPINSVWIYGIGSYNEINPHPYIKNIQSIYSNDPLYKSLSELLDVSHRALSPSFEITHSTWIDAQSVQTQQDLVVWENIWQQALKALHNQEVNAIEIFQEQFIKTPSHGFVKLQRDNFSAPLLKKLFNSQKARESQYPSWDRFIQTSKQLKPTS